MHHALVGVLRGGGVVVIDGRPGPGRDGQSRYGDHGGGGHHGAEDERQAVGHVPVGGARQRRGVTYNSHARVCVCVGGRICYGRYLIYFFNALV